MGQRRERARSVEEALGACGVAGEDTPGGAATVHARLWSGPPLRASRVVLLHGIVSSRYLVPTARRLARSCMVVAPDLPGRGLTPASGCSFRIDEMADLVASWMAASDLEGSTVVGHSIGAQTAVALAARHPGAVGGLVLAGPTVDRRARNLRGLAWRWLVNAPSELRFNALAAREFGQIGPARVLRALRRALDDAIEDTLAAVTCPVLLVRGEHDRLAPQEWLEELQRRRPGSRLAVLPGAAHTVVYSHPAPLARIIVDFAGTSVR